MTKMLKPISSIKNSIKKSTQDILLAEKVKLELIRAKYTINTTLGGITTKTKTKTYLGKDYPLIQQLLDEVNKSSILENGLYFGSYLYSNFIRLGSPKTNKNIDVLLEKIKPIVRVKVNTVTYPEYLLNKNGIKVSYKYETESTSKLDQKLITELDNRIANLEKLIEYNNKLEQAQLD